MGANILYASSTEWGNLGRRKVRLAHELARQEGVAAVLFANPPVFTSVLDLVRGGFPPNHLGESRRSHFDALLGRPRKAGPKLWLHDGSLKTLPLTRNERIRRSPSLRRINERLYMAGLKRACAGLPGDSLVLWLTHPCQSFLLDVFSERRICCFDWTDDWSQYSILPCPAADIEKATEQMLREADVVFAVSRLLLERARTVNVNAHLAPNATDFELYTRSSGKSAEALMRHIPSPRLGYVGQTTETLDFPLVRSLAEAQPGWSFVFIGPVWENCRAAMDDLNRLANVHLLGLQPHESLPQVLSSLDVCLLPHLRNPLTQSMDPTKLYDYLASGRPIVSTPVAGTERFADSLYLAETAADFARAIERALHENGRHAATRRKQASENDWPKRVAEMWAVLRESIRTADVLE